MIIVSSKSQMKTRSKLDSGSGEGLGALRFLFREFRVPPIKIRRNMYKVNFRKICSSAKTFTVACVKLPEYDRNCKNKMHLSYMLGDLNVVISDTTNWKKREWDEGGTKENRSRAKKYQGHPIWLAWTRRRARYCIVVIYAHNGKRRLAPIAAARHCSFKLSWCNHRTENLANNAE